MIKLNGKDYKTIVLDTNAIRRMLDDDKQFLTQYLKEFILKEPHAIIISIYTFVELRPFEDIFQKFLNLFDMVPFFMGFPEESIVKAEYEYLQMDKEPELCNGMIYSVTSVENTMHEVNELFIKGIIDPNLEQFVDDLDEITMAWNDNKPSYNSIKNTADYRKYELDTIRKDVINHLGGIKGIEDIKLSHFPSMRLMEFVLFKKSKVKKPMVKNDVMDTRISSIIPYADKVITENQQADFFKQSKSLIPQMRNLEILTLSDIIALVEKEKKDELLNELKKHAITFHDAIVSIDSTKYPRNLGFENFPNGCCGNASQIMARYLSSRGYEVEYVGGLRQANTHGWLECQGIIVDITAYQFSGNDAIIVKPKGKKKHIGFKETDRYMCEDKPFSGRDVRSRLEVFYQEVLNYIHEEADI